MAVDMSRRCDADPFLGLYHDGPARRHRQGPASRVVTGLVAHHGETEPVGFTTYDTLVVRSRTLFFQSKPAVGRRAELVGGWLLRVVLLVAGLGRLYRGLCRRLGRRWRPDF